MDEYFPTSIVEKADQPFLFARIGRLYMNKGNWNGVQIVPQAWVEGSVCLWKNIYSLRAQTHSIEVLVMDFNGGFQMLMKANLWQRVCLISISIYPYYGHHYCEELCQ